MAFQIWYKLSIIVILYIVDDLIALWADSVHAEIPIPPTKKETLDKILL
jgi:hypothetical protein